MINSNATKDVNGYDFLNTAKSTKKADSIDAAQDRFMKLLVTQLQTQDPMNPMDNAAMTSQMAQISTVQGIEKLNQAMTSLQSMYSTSQTVAASALIGRVALAEGNNLPLKNGNATAGVQLAADAQNVELSIFDKVGNLVNTQHLTGQKAGTVNFQWDGKNDTGVAQPDGDYTFAVKATQGTNEVTATPLAFANVVAMGWEGTTPVLHLSNDKTTKIDGIRQLI